MRYVIYPLVNGRDGRHRGEFPMGVVSFESEETGIEIDCADYTLSRRLEKYFSSDIVIRRPLGTASSVMTYKNELIKPGSEEYLREAVSRLHSMGLAASLE